MGRLLAAAVAVATLGVLGCKGRSGPPAPAGDTGPIQPHVPQPQPAERPPKSFAPAPTVGFAGRLEWTQPVEAEDMTRVDITTLLPQARRVAEKLQPGAQFMGLVAFDIHGGVANLAGESRVSYHFEFAGTDPTKPPGKDVVEYKVDVEAKGGALAASRMEWPASRLKREGALGEPKCTSAKMWEVATGSGVPSNAVATIHFYDNRTFSPRSPFVWSVRVDGHDEYRREIDGTTCTMVKNWGKK